MAERSVGEVTSADREIRERWAEAAAEAARPRFVPVAVSDEREIALETDGEIAPLPQKCRKGRYGPVFGEAVHRGIGHALRKPGRGPDECVTLAARETGLTEHLEEAARDVASAIAVLRAEGLHRVPGPTLRLEYPVAGTADGGRMLVGYVDLVAASDRFLDVIDFKTDQPPTGAVDALYPEYVRQVRLYADLLVRAGAAGDRQTRCGLLFTAASRIEWVSS